MRKITLIAMLVFTLFSCKKDDNRPSLDLEGTWELESVSGYNAHQTFPPGNGRLLIFSGRNYERRENNAVVNQGTFYLKRGKDCIGEEIKTRYISGDGEFDEFYINIDGNGKLRFNTSNCIADGGVAVYRKL